MIASAKARFLRISPRKVRQVIDLVRGKDVAVAESILLHLDKRPKEHLLKLLKQAVANAKVKGFSREQLFISRIVCDVGPIWKRYKAAAFGRATPIQKRTSHIVIELDLKK